MSEQYNHHYNARVYNVEDTTTPDVYKCNPSSLSNQSNLIPAGPTDCDVPLGTEVLVEDGNGGEYRNSLHFLAPGYGYLIRSPSMFRVTVMVINTNNPFELAGGQAPLPKNSPAPRNNTGGTYNGLMECPCTDITVVKVPTLTYVFAHDAKRLNGAAHAPSGTDGGGGSGAVGGSDGQICPSSQQVLTASDCAAAATDLLGLGRVPDTPHVISEPGQPAGCSAVAQDDGTVMLQFNNHLQPAVEPGAWAAASRFVGYRLTPQVTLEIVVDAAKGKLNVHCATA